MCEGGDVYHDRGIIPRIINLIFNEIKLKTLQKNNNNFTYKIQITFMEIYKEIGFRLGARLSY